MADAPFLSPKSVMNDEESKAVEAKARDEAVTYEHNPEGSGNVDVSSIPEEHRPKSVTTGSEGAVSDGAASVKVVEAEDTQNKAVRPSRAHRSK